METLIVKTNDMTKEEIIKKEFDKFGGFETVKAKPFKHNGFDLHIRKDEVWIGYRNRWIITENSSGALFCFGDTKLETLILMDILFEKNGIKGVKNAIIKKKAEQFDALKTTYILSE